MDADKSEELNYYGRLEQYKQLYETQRALLKSVNLFGIHALRGIFFLNSGGAVAVLAHTKALENIKGGADSVKYFAIGALLSVLATGASYLCELFSTWNYQITSNAIFDRKDSPGRLSCVYRTASLVFLSIAILLFCLSCYHFYKQLSALEQLFSICATNSTVAQP